MANKLAIANEIKQKKMNDKAALVSIKAQMEFEAKEKSRLIMEQKQKGV